MARIRITSANVKSKIIDWKNNIANRADELVFNPTELDVKDIQLDAFNKNVLINILQDIGPFQKIVFVEILM